MAKVIALEDGKIITENGKIGLYPSCCCEKETQQTQQTHVAMRIYNDHSIFINVCFVNTVVITNKKNNTQYNWLKNITEDNCVALKYQENDGSYASSGNTWWMRLYREIHSDKIILEGSNIFDNISFKLMIMFDSNSDIGNGLIVWKTKNTDGEDNITAIINF